MNFAPRHASHTTPHYTARAALPFPTAQYHLLLPRPSLDKDEPTPDLGFDEESLDKGRGGAKSATDGRDSVGFGEDSFGIEDESLMLPGSDTPVKPTKKEPATEDTPKPKEEPLKPKASVDEDR